MYNFQSDPEFFKGLQDYYSEESTEEAIIKRQHAARTKKAQERLLGRIGAGLVSFKLRVKAQEQPETVTPIQPSC